MDMTTTRIPHPAELAGGARRLWAASVVADVTITLAVLAALGWAALSVRFEDAVLPVFLVLVIGFAGPYIGRYLRWLSWAEVPGGFRWFGSTAEANRAAPSARADVIVASARELLTAVAGVVIAALPAPYAATTVGLFGACFTAFHFNRFVQAVLRRKIKTGADRLYWVAAAVTCLAWSLAGHTAWWGTALFISALIVALGALFQYMVGLRR